MAGILVLYITSVLIAILGILGICSGSLLRKFTKIRIGVAIVFLLGIILSTALIFSGNGLLFVHVETKLFLKFFKFILHFLIV